MTKMKHQHPFACERLKRNREKLVAAFMEGREPAFLERHAGVLDDYFRECFETSLAGPRIDIARNPFAIIAQGGYGRNEQCVHSDVDLLFLFKKSIPAQTEELIRETVYPLWDLGLEVGYATRSLKECLRLASRDFEVLTPLLDARFVCGMSILYSELLEELRKKILQRHPRKVIAWLIERNRDRHRQYGDSAYLLEPNLKEGKGGLRDYHTILWIGRVKFDLKQPRDLEYYGYLSNDEYRGLTEALGFIWAVRNRLHHLTGRKCDQLHFEYQTRLAEAMDYAEAEGYQPVERFLGELHGHMELIKQLHQMFLYELQTEKSASRFQIPWKQSPVEGLEVRKGMLSFASLEAILRSPRLLLEIFGESARMKVPLSAEARRVVRDLGYLVDDRFRSDPWAVKTFEQVLVTPAPDFSVLNAMLNSGFLVRFIPEMQGIVHRIQYDEYHLYPVDRHSLRTVQTIKAFGTPQDTTGGSFCGDLYREIPRRKLLLWAALLHDIGKVEAVGGHSRRGAEIARSILTRSGLDPEEVDTVSFLVREHLLLTKTATRRDINDEETAISCARIVKDPQRLRMLYLLTVADSLATGPNAWNDWTAFLLRDFFFKIANILEKGELASLETMAAVEEKRQRIISSAETAESRLHLENLLQAMSPRYLIYASARELQEHIRLYHGLADAPFVWSIARTESNTRTVTVCAKDRPGLFSRIAGTFTLNHMDILSAQIFTWKNNIALDIFELKPPPDQVFEEERWIRADQNLKAALSGELDLAEALREKMARYRSRKPQFSGRPHRVVVDNRSSSFFTLVEVFTYDFPGLLYSITDALYRLKLDIWVAKIATKVDQVVDVFYVRDLEGEKVDSPEQIEAIKAAIIERLPGQ
jgi:[protein-PII] uridylyltransferase